METAKALQNRLDAVFGGLEGAGSSTQPWLPTLQPVFRAGRIETHSDDEDEKVEERRRQGLEGIEELLEEDPDRAPSYAFCRVVDGEEDFSAVDAVADPLAEDPSLPSLSTPVDEAGGEGAGTSSRLGRPPQQRPGPLPAALKKGRLLDHEGQAVAPSIVPDHVRHPERYMRYTFDQEIQVGGGVAQLAESATTQVAPPTPPQLPDEGGAMEQSGSELSGPQQQPADRQLPAPGKGAVTFRPRDRPVAGGTRARPSRGIGKAGEGLSLDLSEEDGYMGEEAPPASPLRQAQRQSSVRRYRRAGMEQ
ncbi:hypothetical protein ACKKBF_B12855 [Auxenochlorella protothecoides x Auxenochlorella symbiontica]